jgi:hypothetical protein
MLNDIEDMIKQKLLEDLIDQMGDKSGDRLSPPGLAVKVAAPDKEGLSEGLDKAKDALPNIPEPGKEAEAAPSEDDDESRLLALLSDDDDEDKK